MTRVLRLLFGALVRGALVAHLGGALLFALLVAVESADAPFAELIATLRTQVPGSWARAAAVLGLVGVAVAVTRLRRQGVVLGLGTLGVNPRILLFVGATCGALAGLGASGVRVDVGETPGAWERGEGGWIRDGLGYPDPAATEVYRRPPPQVAVSAEVTNGATAGGLGAALGLGVGAPGTLVAGALFLVADLVARGLVERGALPEVARLAPAALALVWGFILYLRAPLFPRRW